MIPSRIPTLTWRRKRAIGRRAGTTGTADVAADAVVAADAADGAATGEVPAELAHVAAALYHQHDVFFGYQPESVDDATRNHQIIAGAKIELTKLRFQHSFPVCDKNNLVPLTVSIEELVVY